MASLPSRALIDFCLAERALHANSAWRPFMVAVQALGSPGYLPRRPGSVLTRIVETHLDELRQCYDERFARTYGPLDPHVLDLFERFLRCGDPHFGFLRLRCEDCGHERFLPFSCKARGLCPSCGKRRAIEWAERMVEDVLPQVPYAPLVFTIPKILWSTLHTLRQRFGWTPAAPS